METSTFEVESLAEPELLDGPIPVASKPKRNRKPKPKTKTAPARKTRPKAKTKPKRATGPKTKAKRAARPKTAAKRKPGKRAGKFKPGAGMVRTRVNGEPDLRTMPRSRKRKLVSGQSIPLGRKLVWANLNKTERKLIQIIAKTVGAKLSVTDLSKRFRNDEKSEYNTAKLAVRNGVRRPVRAGLILNAGRGLYKLSAAGARLYADS